jgi:hypothetical protein
LLLQGHRGLEVVKYDETHISARLFCIGRRLYEIRVNSTSENHQAADHFLDSFRFIGPLANFI